MLRDSLQVSAVVCCRHSMLCAVILTATSCGLLQPHHIVACYSHTTLWPVTATPHCGLLQPHHIVACYSHTTLWPVTATPHCGLLQPHHIMVCYHHIVRPVTATLHHGLLPPHNVATHGCYFSARWLVWLGGSHHFTSVHIASNDLCFFFNPKPCQVKRRVKLWHQVQYCVVVYTNQCEWSSVSVG